MTYAYGKTIDFVTMAVSDLEHNDDTRNKRGWGGLEGSAYLHCGI